MLQDSINLITVLGPTASGKTRLGVDLARHFNGEIISADSRQVYRELNIGTGKDLEEYASGGERIPYHLIDCADLEKEYSLFDFQDGFRRAWSDCRQRGKLPLLVGGSGLYLEAALKGYRLMPVPENPRLHAKLCELSSEELTQRLLASRAKIHNTTDLQQKDRLIRAIEIAEYSKEHEMEIEPGPDIHPLILGVCWEREMLRDRIRQRLQARMEAGLIDEVKQIIERGISPERLHRLGLEYRFVTHYLQTGKQTKTEMFQALYQAICDFAKRQMTWFRRMERHGLEIRWLPGGVTETAEQLIEAKL